MVDASLVYSVLAVLPPGAAFFLAYGRWDGAFRDNVVFLHFMGGILMGFLLGFLTIFALGIRAPIPIAVFLSLLYPVSIVVAVNRRRWQGERHAVFNGGAFALGSALMLGFTFLYVLYKEVPLSWETSTQAFLFCAGLSGLFFALGMLAGDGVRRKKPFRAAFTGTAAVLAPVLFLQEFAASRAWLWVALLLAYGLVAGVAAERRLLLEGADPEEIKRRRRERRKARA
ncbi:MAG TPA: hypothetical protein VHH36_01190 [Candidatus Thermoplasmatota archaeon]|nr:hypothetical protein [Candidatus Thermoplasmatota archaeon]